MAESKIFTALLKLSARLDGSFRSSIQSAERQLQHLDNITKKIGHGSGSSFNLMARNAEHSFNRIGRGAALMHSKVMEGLRFGLGFGIGDALFSGAERAVGLVGEGSGIAAEREQIAVQMRTILENQKQGDKLQTLLNQMRIYSDSESVFRYNTVAGAASQMLVSKYKPGEVLPEMRKLGELARNDEQLALVADIYSQGKNQGYVTKGLLTRLQKDAKVPIYSALLQAMGKQDNLQSESELFKRLRNPNKNPVGWEYMEKALNILTGPGGALHGHQKEQQQTFGGQLNSVLDRWNDILGGIGGAANKFALPLMNEINKISPVEIQSWFDNLSNGAQKFGGDLAKAFDIEAKTGKLQDIANHIGGIFGKSVQEVGKLFGVFSSGKSTTDTLVAVIDKLDGALAWLDGHMESIANGVKMFVAAWATFKGLGIAAELLNIGKALAIPGLLGAGEGVGVATGAATGAATAPILATLGTLAAGSYLVGKGMYAGQDAEIARNATLAQRSADLAAGGPKQTDAAKQAAMADHWKRLQDVYDHKIPPAPSEPSNWMEKNSAAHDQAGSSTMKSWGDNWNSMWQQLDRSSQQEIQSADKVKTSFDGLSSAVTPTANSFGRVTTAATSVAAALDGLSAKIASWKPPASPAAPGTASTTSFGRAIDDDLHQRLRSSYA
jgi:hypothetical protein